MSAGRILQPAESGPIRYYETEADMPPEMRARRDRDAAVLKVAQRHYDAVMAAIATWPAPARALVEPHRPRLFIGEAACSSCIADADGTWPCWVITTAEGTT